MLLEERALLCPELAEWLKRRVKWLSGEIQNEIIEILAHMVQRKLIDIINKSQFFALMADGTTDVSGDEQFCVALRIVDQKSLAIQELFMGVYNSPDGTAMTLHRVCKDEVCKESELISNSLSLVREVSKAILESAKRKTIYDNIVIDKKTPILVSHPLVKNELDRRFDQPGMQQLANLESLLLENSVDFLSVEALQAKLGVHSTDFDLTNLAAQLRIRAQSQAVDPAAQAESLSRWLAEQMGRALPHAVIRPTVVSKPGRCHLPVPLGPLPPTNGRLVLDTAQGGPTPSATAEPRVEPSSSGLDKAGGDGAHCEATLKAPIRGRYFRPSYTCLGSESGYSSDSSGAPPAMFRRAVSRSRSRSPLRCTSGRTPSSSPRTEASPHSTGPSKASDADLSDPAVLLAASDRAQAALEADQAQWAMDLSAERADADLEASMLGSIPSPRSCYTDLAMSDGEGCGCPAGASCSLCLAWRAEQRQAAEEAALDREHELARQDILDMERRAERLRASLQEAFAELEAMEAEYQRQAADAPTSPSSSP
ncbi:hypothetical protein FOCC_FOCC014941 [Frankliniella occidentalis]|nr:hypothetical protein FOCC_FOCC014941 [Frankliniella occidentalis]